MELGHGKVDGALVGDSASGSCLAGYRVVWFGVRIWWVSFVYSSSFELRPPRWPSGKASASRAEDPGFESRLRRDFFGVESYQ